VVYENPVPAAAVVVRREGQVLLCRRCIDPYRGSWTLPAGYQEVDETIETTAVREVREETGLVVRLTALLDVMTTTDDPRKPAILVVYEAEEVEGELLPGTDADEVGFHVLEQLPEPLGFANHRRILERLRRKEVRAW
jgi:ADP-ribose pyrophosphatase YjhB (NUDIX family)